MMTRCLSVVTPVHAPALQFLSEAYNSLAEQALPAGWTWEWLVQEDGEDGVLVNALPNDARISPGSGRHGGPGMARTMALSRATGEIVKVLDADDLLTPGALARDIEALSSPTVQWATSRVLDLLPDGSKVGFPQDPSEGAIPRRSVLEHWRSHDYRASVHPASLCIRMDLLLALGGWMALPASEDTGLLIALNAVSDGYFSAEAGLLYRKWPGQITEHTAHFNGTEREARMRIIDARAKALAKAFPSGVQPVC